MTQNETLAALPAVASISAPFGRDARLYVNLSNTNRAYKGDARKIYIIGNSLICDSYKGCMSPAAIESLYQLKEAATALGMQVSKW